MPPLPQPSSIPQWAPRVRPEKIRRLYQGEAQGLLDEDLLNEVFYAFYARCQSILTCSEAAAGRVHCPVCETVIQREDLSGRAASRAEVIICPTCGWNTTWEAYLNSYQGRQLFIGGAGPAIQTFVDDFPKARTPRDRMLMIDALIHAYHWEAIENPTRPVAVNMIAANVKGILVLLQSLAYGENDKELTRSKQAWDEKTRQADENIWHGALLGKRKEE